MRERKEKWKTIHAHLCMLVSWTQTMIILMQYSHITSWNRVALYILFHTKSSRRFFLCASSQFLLLLDLAWFFFFVSLSIFTIMTLFRVNLCLGIKSALSKCNIFYITRWCLLCAHICRNVCILMRLKCANKEIQSSTFGFTVSTWNFWIVILGNKRSCLKHTHTHERTPH